MDWLEYCAAVVIVNSEPAARAGGPRAWPATVVVALALVVASAAVSGQAQRAQADDGTGEAGAAPATEKEKAALYRTTIKDALREYQLGNWDEALSLFQRAHALSPNARTLNGMGKVAYENRQYLLAIAYLRSALAETRNPVTAQQRAEVVDLIRRAEGFVVHFTLDLDPAGATLLVDSAPAERTSDGELLMDAGQHEVVASAPDHENVVRQVRAVVGARERLTFRLPRVTGATQPSPVVEVAPAAELPLTPAAQPAAADSGAGAGLSTLTWVGVIAAAAGLTVGTATGLWALSNDGSLEKDCPRGICQPRSSDKLDATKTLATVSTVGFGLAAAGLIAAAVGLLIAPGSEAEASEPAARPSVTVAAQATNLTLHF